MTVVIINLFTLFMVYLASIWLTLPRRDQFLLPLHHITATVIQVILKLKWMAVSHLKF